MPMPVSSRGFTLVEMVIVIVVLAVGLVGVTLVINRTVIQSPQALIQTRAMEIAQSYLDEVMGKRFDEHSGQGGVPRCDSTDTNAQACSASLGSDATPAPAETSRDRFDDVDDYDGLNHSPPQSLSTGTTLDKYSGYSVAVNVQLAGTELGYADNGRAKRITISVTTPLDQTLVVSAYRVNF